MKEFIDKTTDVVEEKEKVTSLEIIVTGTKDKPYFQIKYKEVGKEDYNIGYGSYYLNNVLDWKEECFEIVNEIAEEYKDKSNIIDGLKSFLKKKFDYCAEQAEMNLEAECNSEIDSYFRGRKELYLDRANIYGEVMREIDRLAEEYKGGCCAWTQFDENDIYYTGCEQIHMFIDGSPTDNSYKYCPYCGKKIKVAPYTEGE